MVNLHGTGVVLGGHGLMLRGRSGAGKSLLALELLDRWRDRGEEAYLIADDRIEVGSESGRLVMSPPPNIAGLIELRGRGIVRRESRDMAPLDLVVDMTVDLVRFLEDDDFVTLLEGVEVARCPVPERGVVDSAHQVLLVREAISQLPAPAGAATRRRRQTAKKGA